MAKPAEIIVPDYWEEAKTELMGATVSCAS
jgi:hypothetical protein